MSDPESRFNLCDKRRAILAARGHILITGGPGAGKTTIALLKARRLALEGLEDGQEILFLSFSNAAVRRLAEGVAEVLSDEVSRQLQVKTYHGFCWDILRAHGYLVSGARRLSIVSAQDADVRRAGLSYTEWALEQERLFEEEGLVTYDQFAPRAVELFARTDWLRDLYADSHPVIVVDEFQDTDDDQWALLRCLAEKSEVIALGDGGQRIYEWRKGVSSTRLDEFRDAVAPHVYSFGEENNRSPSTGIGAFGNALLTPGAVIPWCDEVKRTQCVYRGLGLAIKFATLTALKEARKHAARDDVSIAIVGRTKSMVRVISDELTSKHTFRKRAVPPVRHDVLIDQSQVLLSARVGAFLLEAPCYDNGAALAHLLDLIADVHRSGGKPTHIAKGRQIDGWAKKVREGKVPKTKLCRAVTTIQDALAQGILTGKPREDWIAVRRCLDESGDGDLQKVADFLRYLRLLRKGSAIEAALMELWRRNGTYSDAMNAVDEAILQDQVADGMRPPATCTVMTMHQLKAREYDAVVIVEDQHRRFLGRGEEPPHLATRRLMQVAVTRARHAVRFVTPKTGSTFDELARD